MPHRDHLSTTRAHSGFSDVTDIARRMWRRSHAGRVLLKLNDRTLEDIGLSRNGVRRMLAEASLRDLRHLLHKRGD